MTTSLGVAILLVSLSMTKYAESFCLFANTRNAHTERSSQLNYTAGERVNTTCFDGYVTSAPPPPSTSFIKTCLSNGDWDPLYECNPIMCSGLPVVDGADILYVSTMVIENNQYPYRAEAQVICPPGTRTDRGRTRYTSRCAITSTWSDTSACTAAPATRYTIYNVQLTETSLTYSPTLGNQALEDSINRALFPVFEGEFGGTYVRSQDYEYSRSGQNVRLDFSMLFLPSVTMAPEVVERRILSALERNNFQATDSNTGTTYTFQRRFVVSDVPVNQFSRAATIGLAIAGALVAIMFIAVLIACCCCRPGRKVFDKPERGGYYGPPAPAPPAAVISPYAQLSDVGGLPRNF